MKILICGECPDPLTTVAQSLNRLRVEQMRSELSQRNAAATPPSDSKSSSQQDPSSPAGAPLA